MTSFLFKIDYYLDYNIYKACTEDNDDNDDLFDSDDEFGEDDFLDDLDEE